MLELVLILLFLIPSILLAYKIGRKKKKTELDTMAYITLGGITMSVILFGLLKLDLSFDKSSKGVKGNTVLDY
jgi:hypothetical protein